MFQVDMGQRRYAGYHNKYQMTRISTSDVFVHPHGCPYSYLRNDSLCTRKNSKFFESDAFIKQIFLKLSESIFATQWKVEEEGKDLEHMS